MQWECGYANENFYAGFPHLYWRARPCRAALCARQNDTAKQKDDQNDRNGTECTFGGYHPGQRSCPAAAHAHWASLAKPLGGLGRLETMLEDAAALTGSAELDLSCRVVVVLCADNGVVAQGVSQTGQEVTRAVAEKPCYAAHQCVPDGPHGPLRCSARGYGHGRRTGARRAQLPHCRRHGGFYPRPCHEPGRGRAGRWEGIALARELAEDGYRLIATGEMGIGNTTTSSAVAAVLLGQPVELMTGRGAGLSDEGLARKVDAICRGILCNEPDPEDALMFLQSLAALISRACAVCFWAVHWPVCRCWQMALSAGGRAVRRAAVPGGGKGCVRQPLLRRACGPHGAGSTGQGTHHHRGLHLGEGTGAVASIPLWDMALAVYGGCYSFAEGGIEPYKPQC